MAEKNKKSDNIVQLAFIIVVLIYILISFIGSFSSIRSNPENLALIVVTILATLVVVYVTKKVTRIEFNLEEISKSIEETKSTQLEKAVDKKKEIFLSIPTISFQFANEDEINSYYNDYFKEPTIEKIVSEKASEVGSKATGSLYKVLEATAEGKDINKWISTIKLPDISVSEKFRRYQRETIKNNQVTLGLELVDIDLRELDEFNKFVSDFESKFSMKLVYSEVESQRRSLTEKAVEKTMIRLENASDWILLEGKFRISNLSNDLYKLIYEHPVNEYFSEERKKVTMSIMLRKDMLKANVADNFEQSIGKIIPLKVYGRVWKPMNRKEDFWELQIIPLAMY